MGLEETRNFDIDANIKVLGLRSTVKTKTLRLVELIVSTGLNQIILNNASTLAGVIYSCSMAMLPLTFP